MTSISRSSGATLYNLVPDDTLLKSLNRVSKKSLYTRRK
jgi:hypothetical protein